MGACAASNLNHLTQIKRNMRILVTGATGFIGGALVRRLLSEGANVRALVRNPDSAAWLRNEDCGIVQGDVTELSACAKAARETDAVFHCAGVLGGWGIKHELLWKVNYEGTKNMLEAAEKAKAKKFVHVSSCGIFGPLNAGESAGDDRQHNPVNAYERSKAESETLALSFARRGQPVTVVRPEWVYGPGDMHLLSLFKAVGKGRFAFFGGGKSLLHPTYVDDAVDAMVAAAKEKAAIGQAFNIAGERAVTVKEFIKAMADAIGCEVPKANVPVAVAKAAGALLDGTWGIFAKPPLTLAQAGYLSENRCFRTDKAGKVLGYKAKIGIDEGMRRAVAWYRKQGLLE